MYIVIEAALLDVVILQFPAERPNAFAGQIIHQFHPQHEVEVDQGIFSLVPNDPVLICDTGHSGEPPFLISSVVYFQRVEKVFSPRCASFSEPEEVQKNLD
jgi:hypothetical protein